VSLECFIMPGYRSDSDDKPVFEKDGTPSSAMKIWVVLIGLFQFTVSCCISCGIVGAVVVAFFVLLKEMLPPRVAVELQNAPVPAAFRGQDVLADPFRPVIVPRVAVRHENAPEPFRDRNRAVVADPDGAGPAARHEYAPQRGVDTEHLQLTRSQIDKLVEKMETALKDTGSEVCSVCLEGMSDAPSARSRAVLLPSCDHAFHSRCISLWLSRGKKGCPVCRRDILGLDTG
jgi:Ring finger domain